MKEKNIKDNNLETITNLLQNRLLTLVFNNFTYAFKIKKGKINANKYGRKS